ncbi:MAG: long-chain fatty acid--CoA ligase, partial [Thermoanaerobaculia bacterium]|nr:long-chain fatty acid--CoA ligase [Thermoanaerobaculia bacterium]
MALVHLAHMIRESATRFGPREAMRHRDARGWHSITYAELSSRVEAMARALVSAGVEAGDRVAIFAPNGPDWAIADFGILTAGAVGVPIYATDTARQAEQVFLDAGAKLLFVGGQEQLDKAVAFESGAPALVAFDPATRLSGPCSSSLADFLARTTPGSAAQVEARLAAAKLEDLATIIYTSGTTGDRKGAMLTHANFASQFRALDERFEFGPEDRSLCFLPLSHVYERAWSYFVFRSGATNAYLRDPKDAVAAMPEVRPTAMVSVPRLYEKVYSAIQGRVSKSPPLRRRLFRWALETGSAFEHASRSGRRVGSALRMKHRLADRLVLSKVREAVGGDKKFFSAGGAPLSKEIEEFFLSVGLLVCQGYGLTETSPMVTCNAPGAFRFGTVGRPIPGCEVRIGDAGEVQVRGDNVMKGYWGKPAETAAVFEDGWFKTGDVGVLEPDGFLRITDRIKDLIITSQGKNVAPQRVEGMLAGHPLLEQVVVLGDRRTFLSALVVPNFPALEERA